MSQLSVFTYTRTLQGHHDGSPGSPVASGPEMPNASEAERTQLVSMKVEAQLVAIVQLKPDLAGQRRRTPLAVLRPLLARSFGFAFAELLLQVPVVVWLPYQVLYPLSVHFRWPLFSGQQIWKPKLRLIHVLSVCLHSRVPPSVRNTAGSFGQWSCRVRFEGRRIWLFQSVLRSLGIGFGDVGFLVAPLFYSCTA